MAIFVETYRVVAVAGLRRVLSLRMISDTFR